MQAADVIGKVITNMYSLVNIEVSGLDSGECFIELDHTMIIDIPFAHDDEIRIKALHKDAVSLFADLSDYPVYHVNKGNKTIEEIVDNDQHQKRTLFSRLRQLMFGRKDLLKAYQPYAVEYRENALKQIKDRKVVDFIWYADGDEKGLFLLDNGYLISETLVAPHGTGLAGLNLFENLTHLSARKGNDFLQLTHAMSGRP